jgi:hypothetical protein
VIFFPKAPANWDFMEDFPTPVIAEHVWQPEKTTRSTPPNSRPAPNAHTRQPLGRSAAAVTQRKITSFDTTPPE